MANEDDYRLTLSHEVSEADSFTVLPYDLEQTGLEQLTDCRGSVDIKTGVLELASCLVESLLLLGHLLLAGSSLCHLDLVQNGPRSAAGTIGA